MPVYVYKCAQCQHLVEVRQKVNDEPLKVCPNCQGQLKRQFQPVGIIFKGSGFYTTDYKRSENGEKKKAEVKKEVKKAAG
jgi:putative FmdB family regulatory protein